MRSEKAEGSVSMGVEGVIQSYTVRCKYVPLLIFH